MKRDLDAFARPFDVLVVGGGVYGACIARLAARGGYSVALVERDDFGGGVSHNSLKIVHGGFRYVQRLELARIRESVAAQRAWLSAAPHLVRPLRFVIPTYGHGFRGPAALTAGICAYHALAWPRGRGLDSRHRLPASGLISRRTLLADFPQLDDDRITAGAHWHDAQILDPGRLVLECIEDAVGHGAAAANHVEAASLLRSGGKVVGAAIRDLVDGGEHELRARVTVNATGPAFAGLAGAAAAARLSRAVAWNRNLNLVTRRLLPGDVAIGAAGRRRHAGDSPDHAARFFFLTPWNDRSIVGTRQVPWTGDPGEATTDPGAEVAAFLDEIHHALPRFDLAEDDVLYVHSGLTPAENPLTGTRRNLLVDHVEDRLEGLLTVIGTKFTTAPTMAAHALKTIGPMIDRRPVSHREFGARLPGAPQPGSPGHAANRGRDREPTGSVGIYGRRAAAMLAAHPGDGLAPAEHLFRCRVLYGIEQEMVVRLSDAVFRATGAAESGSLTAERLEWCADTLAHRFGWDEVRRREELADVYARLRRAGFRISWPDSRSRIPSG